jgi:hypothetical protein
MKIAFAYAAAAPGTEPLYEGLLKGLIENLRDIYGNTDIVQVSDEKTPIVKGVNHVLRVPRTMPLMTWRLKAHQEAHALEDELLMVEPDVRFLKRIDELFDDGDSEIIISTRDCSAEWGEENLGETTPYTMGSSISRNREFWREAKLVCQTLPERDQHWIGDMKAIKAVVDSGKFKVRVVPGEIYNHIPNSVDDIGNAKVMHYKGRRKNWLFPLATEVVNEAA